ncbi:MAG TPA: SPASM domain-containing protein [Sedimentisphaerales bacterium]|nr:SPASM domain-containing protein [Sedimentisphaerales bacterium]
MPYATGGLSLDGPREMHDRYRLTRTGEPSHEQAMRGYRLLRQNGVPCEILCVVSEANVRHPLAVYRFFKEIVAVYVSFLPLVEREPQAPSGVSDRTVSSEAWGDFLCTVFDEWAARDIGRVKVQIFEEAARPAFGQEHTLCAFRATCGGVPVVEHNGDFFSCDHFVDAEHRLGNIRSTPLTQLLDDPRQKAFGQAKLDTLPRRCRECEVLAMCHGGCPKDRFLVSPEGEAGLNYLCAGYKRFFNHCRPFGAEVAALWRRQRMAPARTPVVPTAPRTGRNDPCPCGSGRKYKNCCLRG